MEKALALVLPDRSGTLREVLRILSSNEVTLMRVSYNRVVDVHTLFLDVHGTAAAILAAEEELREWRFMLGQRAVGEVYLLDVYIDDDLSILQKSLTLLPAASSTSPI